MDGATIVVLNIIIISGVYLSFFKPNLKVYGILLKIISIIVFFVSRFVNSSETANKYFPGSYQKEILFIMSLCLLITASIMFVGGKILEEIQKNK